MNIYAPDISHLENSSEFLCSLTDTNFRFLHTNRSFQKKFGLDNKAWKGLPFPEVIQTFQMEKFLQANTECIKNPGKSICIEIQTVTAAAENWFRWEVSAIVGEKTEVEGVRFIGTDITKQKKAEQALLQQAILFDNISDAIVSTDRDFCIKSWNLKAEMMFHLKLDHNSKIITHQISKIDFINNSEVNVRRALDSTGFWNGDICIEKKDGIKYYFQTMVNSIQDKTGNTSGFVAVSRDITKEHEIKNGFNLERKKSKLDLLKEQEALKKSNELFEYAGKATRDVIWDLDVTENKIRRTWGYKNLFGYPLTDLYQENGYDKIHPEDIERVKKIIQDALSSDESRWQLEYQYLCADGSYKTVIDQAYIIRDDEGKAVRLIGSMQDVTEERNLQKQVLITEIQKKKDVVTAVINAQEKERNELSAELHDNINQLLAASILYLKTAKKQDVIEESLISLSLDHVEKAVNELRSISHNLTAGELKMNGLCTALKALTEKLHIPQAFAISFVSEEIDESKINPTFQLAVYRIVQEIINNILKHANATEVNIHLGEQENILKLTVTDNGNGFDTATVKKGLGITNIFTRAENFGGAAEVISSPGCGCTWHINIPLI
jgi:PAS domain S-box-containing protein